MTHLDGKGKYVAEIRIPTYFYSDREEREVLLNPEAFGVIRGYWILRPLEEPSESEGFAEFVLVIEFPHKTLKDAENHALEVGRKFGSIASGYAGYPFESPRIHRIAFTDIGGNLIFQSSYWYGNKLHTLSRFDQTQKYGFQKYLKNVSQLDESTRYRVLAAIHWYGISVSAIDDSNSFVAAWTGLECIGIEIDSKFHPSGPKAPCKVCCNVPGKKRGRKIAGIEHMIRRITEDYLPKSISGVISKDLVEGFSTCEAHKLRSQAVHGLEDIDELVQKCSECRRHLIHVLNAAILHTIGPSTDSWVTGHYELHPAGRISFKLGEAPSMKPYLEDWIKGLQVQTIPIEISKDAAYPATTTFEWRLGENVARVIEFTSEEVFIRDSDIYDSPDENVMQGLHTWYDRPDEPVWKKTPYNNMSQS